MHHLPLMFPGVAHVFDREGKRRAFLMILFGLQGLILNKIHLHIILLPPNRHHTQLSTRLPTRDQLTSSSGRQMFPLISSPLGPPSLCGSLTMPTSHLWAPSPSPSPTARSQSPRMSSIPTPSVTTSAPFLDFACKAASQRLEMALWK